MTDTEVQSIEAAANIKPKRNFYFINEIVEDLLRKFIWTGSTSIEYRDAIMAHASELIRQIIRKQGLNSIYPGGDDSSFNDLLQVGWSQIERTLYKFRARAHCRKCFNPDRPNDSVLYAPAELEYGIITFEDLIAKCPKCPKCQTVLSATPVVEPQQDLFGGSTTILYRGPSKVFNMWSQVARTVILAYIKKEGRDRKNAPSYRDHTDNKTRPISDVMERFFVEARDLFKHSDDHLKVIDAMEWLLENDERPHDGMISKLVDRSNVSRAVVTGFIKLVRLRSLEFSDSPINRGTEYHRQGKRNINIEGDEE